MHTYEIFYADLASCDSEWEFLGEVAADDQADALKEAARRFPDYPREDLVACSEAIVACSGWTSIPVRYTRPST
jgi:hypothetical protein